MPRAIMSFEQLAASHRRQNTLRHLAVVTAPVSTDRIMRNMTPDRAGDARERQRVRSALRDLAGAGWVVRTDAGWRITPAGRDALARIDALKAAA
ncbi:hypothetical protein GVN18_34115 [Pseudomonas sp. ODNR1LW]|nr:hypothetical protein [Pseudomonas sp. ODNR1LW]